MNMLTKACSGIILLSILLFACKREELDIDKIAKSVELQRDIALPLIIGDILLTDLMGDDADSIITIESQTSFQDTIPLDLPDVVNDLSVKFLKLPYKIMNYMPVGANIMLLSYDSVSNRIIDTIKFAQSGIFLEAAEMDENGNVIEESVLPKIDSISVNTATAENIFKVATHLILDAKIIIKETDIIPVNDKQRIWIKLGLEAQAAYKTYIDFELE
ncbi:MAG: hypothetical protein JXB34_05965 [Bacteroidales bacterium]|nr:hypothetical protein [Bacteroidales bacterium]